MPVPLGGTSNVFRTDILRVIGAWDPHNVTEDADLGMRLARLGYRTAILDSTTWEEANCKPANWIRQRSRWMKGHLQTWLVHRRDVAGLRRAAGARGVVVLDMFLAGNVFGALISPVLFILWLLWPIIGEPAPAAIIGLNVASLVAGNLICVALAAVATVQRGCGLLPYSLLAPLYGLLASIGAYKALFQLFTRPSFWEKTDHVVSAAAIQRRDAAMAAAIRESPRPVHGFTSPVSLRAERRIRT